ncbi:MAG: universal stress protein [Opitutales bacterium]
MITLLVPVDFSQVTPAVLETAEALARPLQGRIRLLHVIPLGKHAAPYYADAAAYTNELKRDMDKATGQIQKLREGLVKGGLDAEAEVLKGVVVETVLKAAERHQAAYIVMGSHGHGSLYHLVMGSETEGILKKAACPVVIVPPAKAKAAGQA